MYYCLKLSFFIRCSAAENEKNKIEAVKQGNNELANYKMERFDAVTVLFLYSLAPDGKPDGTKKRDLPLFRSGPFHRRYVGFSSVVNKGKEKNGKFVADFRNNRKIFRVRWRFVAGNLFGPIRTNVSRLKSLCRF